MFCCDELRNLEERGLVYRGEKHRIRDGRILNDIDTEYFIRSASPSGYSYIGVNYCPFCGRALSTALWAAEKKK